VTEAGAQRAVLGMLLVVSAVVAWDNIKKTGKATPTGKSLVSLVVLAAILAVGAGMAPSLFGPLALLIGLGVVISKVGKKA
jgi:hypothetical protein